MTSPVAEKQLEKFRGRLAALHKRAKQQRVASSPLVADALAALAEMLEALSTSIEELHCINEELNEANLESARHTRRYLELFRHAPDAYIITDDRGVILDLNDLAEYKFGRAGRWLVGKPLLALVAQADADAFLACVANLRNRQAPIENHPIRFGGGPNPQFDASISALPYRRDDRLEFRWILRDVSESRRTERALRASEARLRAALDVAFDGVLGVDPKGVIRSTNLALRRMFGYQHSQLEGERAELLGLSPEALAKMPRGAVRESLGTRRDGSQFPIEICTRAASPDAGGAIISGVRDLSAQRGLELQLRAATAATAMAEEYERQRLAADLHDDIGQLLSLAGIKLGLLGKAEGNAIPRLREEVADLVNRAHQRTESLMFQLSPPILRDMGLVPAVEWLAEDITHSYAMRVHVEHDGEPQLDEATRVTVFRSLRELLINAARHARARDAEVVLAQNGAELDVTVEDRGIGFDGSATSPGFGLMSVRERVEGLGGRFEIESQVGGGTRAQIVVALAPLPPKERMNGREGRARSSGRARSRAS